MSVLDSGYLASDVLTLNVTIQSVNDEPPELISSLNHTYIEGGGPISLLDSTATLQDNDNCPEHRLISEIRVRLVNLVLGSEDILLDAVGQELEFDELQGGGFEFGSGSEFGAGSGLWMGEISSGEDGSFVVRLTCNQTDNADCYNSLLRGLQYNNTADEPSLHNRYIILEVSSY